MFKPEAYCAAVHYSPIPLLPISVEGNYTSCNQQAPICNLQDVTILICNKIVLQHIG